MVEGVNDLQVPRQQLLKHGDRPALQGLRQHGVVGVGTGLLRDLPGLHYRQQVNARAPRPGGKRKSHMSSPCKVQHGPPSSAHLVPVHLLHIHQDPHQLRYGQGRVGVI